MARTSSSAKTAAKPSQSDLQKLAADLLGAGKPVQLESVDFGDPNRPKTCLEVDFPIVPVNQVAAIEGNAGKPIYQMSKWWARRRSSVFRSLLLAAATKAPDDHGKADKTVWDAYYANHQGNEAFKKLKVADIFMGGGTTLVEGSRLGMRMFGNDLNPVAWLVVKNEMAQVEADEVRALLADIEAQVKPQIMPFYACDCPRGHKGKWFKKQGDGWSATPEPAGFDPLALAPEARANYRYEGPETIYVFWGKHGPCATRGCNHRTPIFSSPVMAEKEFTVKAWEAKCKACGTAFDIEEDDVRMAPGVAQVVVAGEKPFVRLKKSGAEACPCCQAPVPAAATQGKPAKKKVAAWLLVHPDYLAGAPGVDAQGNRQGGSAKDSAAATEQWFALRAKAVDLVEVRGQALPERITLADGRVVETGKGTVPKQSNFACAACGTAHDVREACAASGTNGPMAAYAVQGYCPCCDKEGQAYGGRFFAPVKDPKALVAAQREWERRKEGDLKDWWPRSEIPFGFMTGMANGDIRKGHGFTHWWTMFNARQLLVHAQLLRALVSAGEHRWEVREYGVGAFQQYLRNQNMFAFWNIGADKLEPFFSTSNYHPKANTIENCVFASLGRGNWVSSSEGLLETADWKANPWDVASNAHLASRKAQFGGLNGKSVRLVLGDPVLPATLACGSSTDLHQLATGSHDLVITDPPFGGLLHYSELSDFFFVWLRLALKDRYPDLFGPEYTPKTLEAVANKAREPEDPDAFYRKVLGGCWQEAHRILKPGGILAFTFHHSEDEPWVDVLESLFSAGFYLEATYPIRSDEIKGTGEFGSKSIEYDIIHVCRKRLEDPAPISWARLRRQILADVAQIKGLLESHQQDGLPAADLQVIRRGKALEYFSKHYGQVFIEEGRPMGVKDAITAVHVILEEADAHTQEPPPVACDPVTRQFLRIFQDTDQVPRDQMQKYLRGSGVSPDDFEAMGWCKEQKKVFHLVPAANIAEAWFGKPRAQLTSDYEQAMVLIGATQEGSKRSARDTLNSPNFKPHASLGDLLAWLGKKGQTATIRQGARTACALHEGWRKSQGPKVGTMLFGEED